LGAEGGDTRSLARLASRLARANAAIEVLADGAARYLALRDHKATPAAPGAEPQNAGFEAEAFARLPEEIRLRLLLRAIDRFGHEGPAELGKAEALLASIDRASRTATKTRLARLKQTLAGAVVSLAGGRIVIAPAPPRRHRGD
jgi:tRNA(Ile)-lysidine synthase